MAGENSLIQDGVTSSGRPSSVNVAGVRLDPTITIGPAWKTDRPTITKIRQAPNGIVVGDLPDVRPLSDGRPALAMIVVGCVGFVCLAW
ncbi:MAG: hypothetical protein KDA33_15350, partial [Phycisphaerales bacterium]|nr:hypothetical protein [Phycisphaerales bacterium]